MYMSHNLLQPVLQYWWCYINIPVSVLLSRSCQVFFWLKTQNDRYEYGFATLGQQSSLHLRPKEPNTVGSVTLHHGRLINCWLSSPSFWLTCIFMFVNGWDIKYFDIFAFKALFRAVKRVVTLFACFNIKVLICLLQMTHTYLYLLMSDETMKSGFFHSAFFPPCFS